MPPLQPGLRYCQHTVLNPLSGAQRGWKLDAHPFRTPKSPFLWFPFSRGVSVQIWFHALTAILAGSVCKSLGDEGEIIRQRRKPSYTNLIETKQPFWAAHRAWLQHGLGHLCLLKGGWCVSNKSISSTTDEVTGDEFWPQPSQTAMKTAALNRYN